MVLVVSIWLCNVCVCVCVCERERERAHVFHSLFSSVSMHCSSAEKILLSDIDDSDMFYHTVTKTHKHAHARTLGRIVCCSPFSLGFTWHIFYSWLSYSLPWLDYCLLWAVNLHRWTDASLCYWLFQFAFTGMCVCVYM